MKTIDTIDLPLLSGQQPPGLLDSLENALDRERPSPGVLWLVAFSGGRDSTALAAGLAEVKSKPGLRIELVHIDHQSDPDSIRRSHRAEEIANLIGLSCHIRRLPLPTLRRRRESPEAAARRLRYAALEQIRVELGAERLLTAHHRDDQVETVLLRLLRRAPIEALGGIDPRRGPLLRPLLGVSRDQIERFLAERGLDPVDDPTNTDLALTRNRLRRQTLPALLLRAPGIDNALLALARRSRSARARLAREYRMRLTRPPMALESAGTRYSSGITLDRAAPAAAPSAAPVPRSFLADLPASLRPSALRWLLHEHFAIEQLPSHPSLNSFLEALECGSGSPRLSIRRGEGGLEALIATHDRIVLVEEQPRILPFSYTFSVPGETDLPELGMRIRIRRSRVEPWMFRGDPRRAGLEAEAGQALVRNRRPGDRLQPLGAAGSRKLKELLIDRQIPVAERDRLPILEISGTIAWVAGVALDERFRIPAENGGECWVAELEQLDTGAGAPVSERDVT